MGRTAQLRAWTRRYCASYLGCLECADRLQLPAEHSNTIVHCGRDLFCSAPAAHGPSPASQSVKPGLYERNGHWQLLSHSGSGLIILDGENSGFELLGIEFSVRK